MTRSIGKRRGKQRSPPEPPSSRDLSANGERLLGLQPCQHPGSAHASMAAAMALMSAAVGRSTPPTLTPAGAVKGPLAAEHRQRVAGLGLAQSIGVERVARRVPGLACNRLWFRANHGTSNR